MKKLDGEKPLFGRLPKRAEWRLLEAAAIDMKDHIDSNDLKVVRDICQKADLTRYMELDEYWGLQSINPSVQPVGVRDACLYQLSSLLRKTQWVDEITPVQISNAKAKFLEYEQEMRVYNRVGYQQLVFNDDPKVNVWLTRMRHFISAVLGRFDRDDVQRYTKHGPGGTYSMSSQFGHRYYKNVAIPYETTSSAIPSARRLILSDERWSRAVIYKLVICKLVWSPCVFQVSNVKVYSNRCFANLRLPKNSELFRVVPGNRIEYVPKKLEIARTMALEPSMNVQLQLGVDGHIRTRLKKFKIDINNQSINQDLARRGSIDNSLSTIDLAGASDKISMRLVEDLFPYDWVEYLYTLRSDVGFFPDGNTVRYEKLSSMGNGYTFAVETLIFAACVYAVHPECKFSEDSHVYGDDIIVSTSHVEELMRLLRLCGFEVNTEKSFTADTYTRESCGADFYKGQNYRPVFLKHSLERLDTFAFYSIHNRLKEWFSRVLYIADPTAAILLREWCSTKWRLYGPPDLEDQSSYLAVSKPCYGRAQSGFFIHDRAVASVQTFRHEPFTEWFVVLNDTLTSSPIKAWDKDQVDMSAGSKFTITKRGRYKIRTRLRRGYAIAWPTQHHEL